ncbi:hypothetical protein SESBI_22032 [Sesbania bispinosa]|nr:hypothetical protein SESBI_22032 [Sesbania bispinosa]
MWIAKEAFISPLKILFESLRVVLNKKLVFIFILCFTTLPLSFLTFTLTFSTNTLRSQIFHLQALARVVTTRVEAGHVLEESRVDAISLIRIRGLFSLLCFPLSLAAAVSSVHATFSAVNGKSAGLISAATAVRDNWKRPFATAVFVYAILFAFAPVPRVLAFAFPGLRALILPIGSGVEVYLMAVLSLGLVVSVVEERAGLEAIRVGSDLMQGKRLCGWLLSGLFVLVSGLINRRVEGLLEGPNSEGIDEWDKTVLICSYGLVVLLSYVITTVFYCDNRKRHLIREPEAEEDCENGVSVGSSL